MVTEEYTLVGFGQVASRVAFERWLAFDDRAEEAVVACVLRRKG